ncbi:hypothetical protein QE152_g760 [Popillia japonica]|uniref:Uncharacterized protein n=1 Tax=Popillia japonica TaxID=7064 RepID=A0AAW1NLT3_POPJA
MLYPPHLYDSPTAILDDQWAMGRAKPPTNPTPVRPTHTRLEMGRRSLCAVPPPSGHKHRFYYFAYPLRVSPPILSVLLFRLASSYKTEKALYRVLNALSGALEME